MASCRGSGGRFSTGVVSLRACRRLDRVGDGRTEGRAGARSAEAEALSGLRSFHEERDGDGCPAKRQERWAPGLLSGVVVSSNAAGQGRFVATLVTCECRHPCVGRREGRTGYLVVVRRPTPRNAKVWRWVLRRRSGLIGLGRRWSRTPALITSRAGSRKVRPRCSVGVRLVRAPDVAGDLVPQPDATSSGPAFPPKVKNATASAVL